MSSSGWTWAELTGEQLGLVSEAERTLGTDYLLVYQQGQQATGGSVGLSRGNVQVAALNESQLECLQGLEAQLKSVVVAYRQST